MPRKIQRRPIRYAPVKTENLQETSKVFNFQEAITIFGGLTGLLIAVLWQGGRYYASGYFSSMNIPIFNINFSVWEYAEVSWFRLFVYFITELSYPLLAIGLGLLLFIFLTRILQKAIPGLKIEDGVKRIQAVVKRFWKQSKNEAVITFVIIFIYFLFLSFTDLYRQGESTGKQVVLSQSLSVEVYSKEELPLDSAFVVPDPTPPLFHYSGLKLLTYNNGKYFLFRDVNPETCKPEQVFIIDNSDNIHIVLAKPAPVDGPCSTTATETNTPVLTPQP